MYDLCEVAKMLSHLFLQSFDPDGVARFWYTFLALKQLSLTL
jgi:hypothetical protein